MRIKPDIHEKRNPKTAPLSLFRYYVHKKGRHKRHFCFFVEIIQKVYLEGSWLILLLKFYHDYDCNPFTF